MNVKRFKYPKLVTFIMILLIALPIRYSIERIKPFQERETSIAWTTALKSVDSLDKNPKKVLFNFDKPIRAMFHSNFMVYSTMPSKRELSEIKSKGYSVYINRGVGVDSSFYSQYEDCCFLVQIE